MSNCIREGGKMSDFGINEMLEMQKALQEKYKDKWEHISPEVGKNKLLWMIAADIDNPERNHLIEEMADVLMYYNDVLLCYGISADELKEFYTSKFEKNMNRW